ncbi:MAG: T9SS type A sorting domain-containing protein [Bacteroidales bacterium]|nr:T9SS type A sorting domain-containing protein [Bacteroidales bacterium]
MKKHHYITILLFLLYGNLSSQSWVVNYHGYPLGRTHFSAGFVDEDGVTFLSGQEGPDNDRPKTLLMRINQDGSHSETIYDAEGFYSKATCIVETDDHHLFVAGHLFDDTEDYLIILLFDKNLNLLSEQRIEKEVDAISFGTCRASSDNHGNIIVSSSVKQANEYGGYYSRGVFFKFNRLGEMISHRYLVEEYPSPEYFLMNFQLRQMWYRNDSETLLCLVPGYGGVMSFITFDSDFNYLEEHPIWREIDEKVDHTLFDDCYTDHWLSDSEALFFSSRGDADHNKLRISRLNTQGKFLEYIHLNERPDTIDDAAKHRCMATANDSTFYLSFHQHTIPYYPGSACVYLLNDKMEIIGRHIDETHEAFRSFLIFPTKDGGCITVNDSCIMSSFATQSHPVITKLSRNDFETIPWSVSNTYIDKIHAYPNPTEGRLTIPLCGLNLSDARCQIYDNLGRLITDRQIHNCDASILLDLSKLDPGIYCYRIYANDKTLFSERIIKK